MDSRNQSLTRVVAGLVLARCACCAQAQALLAHPSLEASRRYCPVTRRLYLDRGDGLFEPAPGLLEAEAAAAPAQAIDGDVLSDRPTRTGPKERITLERATFAGEDES
jgi:hypothetical protein